MTSEPITKPLGPPPGIELADPVTRPAAGPHAGGGGGGGGGNPAPAKGGAYALVTGFLSQWGLSSLAPWVWQEYRNLGGGTNALAQIQLEITNRPEFVARFPAYKTLQQQGRAMSVAEMLSYEKTAVGIMRAAGLPAGFYDQPEDIGKFMASQVSVNELQQRVSLAQQASLAPHEAKDALQQMFGLDAGHLTAYYLDPAKSLPLLQQQWTAGQIGGVAQQTGFGQLSGEQGIRLAQLGVDQNQAQTGFGQLTNLKPLMTSTAQEQQNIDQATQLQAQFEGNYGAKSRIDRRRQRRVADFGATSGFGATSTGVSGLGTSGV